MNIRTIIFALFVTWLPAFGESARSTEQTVSAGIGPQWTEVDKNSQREQAKHLLARLAKEIAAGKKELRILAGNYRFDSPAQSVEFVGLNDTTIRAEGAVFWFDSRTGKKVTFKQCRNVSLKGLTIDTDPLPWYQGTLTSVDQTARTMEFQGDAGYQIPEQKRLEGKKRVLFFDGETSLELPVVDERVVRMENLGGGRIRLAKFNGERAFLDPAVGRKVRVGDRVAVLLEDDTGGGIEALDCAGMLLQDITLYGAGGFAYHEAGGGGGNTYLRCKLVRRPGTNRLIASPRDCFHSYLVERGPTIKECEFSFAADDLIAIHGFFGVVLQKLSAREYLVVSPYGNAFRNSSSVQIIDPASGKLRGNSVVRSWEEDKSEQSIKAARYLPTKLKAERGITVRDLNDAHVFKLTFDTNVEAEIHDLISCAAYSGSGAVIDGNFLHDGHVRGILVKTEDLLIRNNTIERTGHGGIVLSPEYYWFEGPVNSKVRIIGNRLHRNGWSTYDRAGLYASIAGIEVSQFFGRRLFPRMLVPGYFNFDIEIRNNVITQPAAFGILVTNTDGVVVSTNTIRVPFAAGPRTGFYDFSRLTDFADDFSPEDAARLKEPYYSIVLFSNKDVSISGNSSLELPDFVKGEEALILSNEGLERSPR